MTKRLANLVYKIPKGTKVDTHFPSGGIIHEKVSLIHDKFFEKTAVFAVDFTDETTTFMDFGHLITVKNEKLKTLRYRRGKLVEIPPEWVGKVTHPQTIRKRKSKQEQGRRYRKKVQR